MIFQHGIYAGLRVMPSGPAPGAITLANAHKSRVEADGGAVLDYDLLVDVFSLLINTETNNSCIMWLNPVFGVKKDGSNNISKVYCLKGADATMDNPAKQPFYYANGSVYLDGVDAYLEFSELTTIRSVVVQCSFDLATIDKFQTPIGHTTVYDFAPAASHTRLFNGVDAGPVITDGFHYEEEIEKPYSSVEKRSILTSYGVRTPINARANLIGNDRNIGGRIMAGNIANLAFFNLDIGEEVINRMQRFTTNKTDSV
jgi:hypothetical protein